MQRDCVEDRQAMFFYTIAVFIVPRLNEVEGGGLLNYPSSVFPSVFPMGHVATTNTTQAQPSEAGTLRAMCMHLFNIMSVSKIPPHVKEISLYYCHCEPRGGELHQYCNIEILLLMVCKADPGAQCLLEFLY